MRIPAILLLVISVVPARANEADHFGDHILICLPLPVSVVDIHLNATFEATLDKAGKVQSISVASYAPHSAEAATAAQQLLRSVRKCWPQGIKKRLVRLTVDLSKF